MNEQPQPEKPKQRYKAPRGLQGDIVGRACSEWLRRRGLGLEFNVERKRPSDIPADREDSQEPLG